jgi:hypothetical protein
MEKRFKEYSLSIKQMPETLRAITVIIFLAGILFIVLAFLFGELDGKQIKTYVFWILGYGHIFFLTGILLIVTGFGFLRRAIWSRPILIFLFLACVLIDQFLVSNPCDCELIEVLI